MQVAIVGLGLMGGSLGLALRERGLAEVVGVDLDADEAAVARERGLVDRIGATLADAVAGADLVVVATPVSRVPQIVGEVLAANPTATVTDLGSTKGRIVAAADAVDGTRFVGGHPICGSEAHGAAHARSGLFEDATWFLTPSPASDPVRFADLHRLVSRLGARPVAIDADEHDRLVGLTSHLPHVLANVLALQVAEAQIGEHRPISAVGGSFRDMTRVAGANPPMWLDILLDNREAVLAAVREAQGSLGEVADAIERSDADGLAHWIAAAAAARGEAIATAHRAEPGDLHEILVDVPDRPGAIAAIAQAVSAAGIGIREFSLSHISTASGGEIRLIVGGADETTSAVEVLRAAGYSATAEALTPAEGAS